MTTRVYGCSDDLIELEGDLSDEIGCYDSDLVLTFSDGTRLKTHYGKVILEREEGVWQISLVCAGTLFERIAECFDSDAPIYSDIAYFADGLAHFEVAKP